MTAASYMRTDATAATRCSSSSRRSSDRLLPNTHKLLNCGTAVTRPGHGAPYLPVTQLFHHRLVHARQLQERLHPLRPGARPAAPAVTDLRLVYLLRIRITAKRYARDGQRLGQVLGVLQHRQRGAQPHVPWGWRRVSPALHGTAACTRTVRRPLAHGQLEQLLQEERLHAHHLLHVRGQRLGDGHRPPIHLHAHTRGSAQRPARRQD